MRAVRCRFRARRGAEHLRQHEQHDEREGEGEDHRERLAQEELDLPPGHGAPELHRRAPPQSSPWPVSLRNVSSSVGTLGLQVERRETSLEQRRRHVVEDRPLADHLAPRRRGASTVRTTSSDGEPLEVALGGERDPHGAGVGGDEPGRRVQGDDDALVHHRHAVAEAVRLVHEVRDQDDRRAAVADALDELPARAPAPPGRGPWSSRRGRRPRGRATSASATSSRWRWPPDRLPKAALRFSVRPQSSRSTS